MDNVTSKIENEELLLMLHGRIDSSNAPAVQSEIAEILKANPAKSVTLDAEALEYLSSAGLRVVLYLKKNCPDFSVINVSPEVYDIFEMTGFTSIMPIRRAFRQMSVEGCPLIAQGAKGAVYRYDSDTVVKKYFNADSLPAIIRERELAKKAFILGIPTAISYDVVKIDEGYGSVFELLEAETYTQCIARDFKNSKTYTDYFAELLRQIHQTEVSPEDMPESRLVADKWLKDTEGVLPAEEHQKLAALIEALPNPHTMIHGDYHTNNLMLQNGETLLIDMDTLSYGHPIWDLANIFFAYKGFGEVDPENVASFFDMPAELSAEVWRAFLFAYLETEDEARFNEVNDKVSLLGYLRVLRHVARRSKGTAAEEEQMAYCKAKIHELLQRVTTLDF